MSDRNWGIVGGGVLGMRLAQSLARQGRRVSVFEAGPELGGLAAAWKLGDITWDRHYHVILLSDRFLRGVLDELDLDRAIRWVPTRTGFYTDGRLHSMSNVVEFLTFPPLGLIDKLRLGATIFFASRIKDSSRLERIPVGEWLRRWSGGRAWEKVWLPLLRAKLGDNHRLTSAAFIWAIIARLYAARRAGFKQEMFGYVPGGYARILARYADRLREEGIEIHTSRPAETIRSAPDNRVVVRFRDGSERTFDRVVATMPAPVAARVCPQLSRRERSLLENIRYMGVLCASLLLRKPLAGYYVTNITEPWVPFTAVVEMSSLVDRAQFGGHHLVYLPKYMPPDDPAFDLPDEGIRAAFVGALKRMYGHVAEEDILSFQVSRARYVLPLATLNYTANLPPMETSVPGLYIVNSAHIVNGTLNVNESLQLAERAAARLLAGEAARTEVEVSA